MFKVALKRMLFCLLMCIDAHAQPSMESVAPGYSYYPPQEDKESWQRLNLLLSSTFIVVANEGQIDLESPLGSLIGRYILPNRQSACLPNLSSFKVLLSVIACVKK